MSGESTNLVRMMVLFATVLLSWATFVIGTDPEGADLQPGDIAEQKYVATKNDTVTDSTAYEDAQAAAADRIEVVLTRDSDVETAAIEAVDSVFDRLRVGVIAAQSTPLQFPDQDPTIPTTSSTSTTTTPTTAADGSSTSTTTTTTTAPISEELARIAGSVFLDTDSDGIFSSDGGLLSDIPFENVGVVAVSQESGEVLRTTTAANGEYVFDVAPGEWELGLDGGASIPADTSITTDLAVQFIPCEAGAECGTAPLGIGPRFRALETQVNAMMAAFPDLQQDSVVTLVEVANDDVRRRLLGLEEAVPGLIPATLGTLTVTLNGQIEDESQLIEAREVVLEGPPLVFVDGEVDANARRAVADVIASALVVNTQVDEDATEAARELARSLVDESDHQTTFAVDQTIIEEGEPFSQFDIDAIMQVGAGNALPVRAKSIGAMLVVLIGILAFYLSRFRAQFWHAPRMVALLGMLIVLGAVSVRLTSEFHDQTSWFILPAVAFGYLAAVLLDNRMGTIMALALGVLAAIGTRDPGVAVYASLATLAPIGFVSRVSSRRSFRNSVATSAVASAAVGASVAWTFFPAQSTNEVLADAWVNVGLPTAWAFGSALVASLVALSVMPFFEGLFDITTTLRLLELTDRNHEALQALQEKAFGTFNHSLMVGTLADAAARGIGANNLLARAAAYYHDIGKTENPMYFIENQFGTTNPHDDLPPEESAQIIRNHVLDGIVLAEKYKIPSEVAEGILAHHGDAVMRFFYEKARQQLGDENVNVDDFRHAGHKPKSREMAIVMMADSVEGACRAVFGEEEPTPEGIEKVVVRVVDEKASDGQLSQSDLTLAELTAVKSAFIEALVGHYHQRIPYPNFPGS